MRTSRSGNWSGPDNFFLFGMTEEQAHATKEAGYNPMTYFEIGSGAAARARGDQPW